MTARRRRRGSDGHVWLRLENWARTGQRCPAQPGKATRTPSLVSTVFLQSARAGTAVDAGMARHHPGGRRESSSERLVYRVRVGGRFCPEDARFSVPAQARCTPGPQGGSLARGTLHRNGPTVNGEPLTEPLTR
jgi:hypothetical protein